MEKLICRSFPLIDLLTLSYDSTSIPKLISVFRFSGYGCIKSRVLFLTYASRDLYLTFILPRGINMNDKRVISGECDVISYHHHLSYICMISFKSTLTNIICHVWLPSQTTRKTVPRFCI